MTKVRADQAGRLLDVVKGLFPDWKTTTLKQRLKAGQVMVNDKVAHSGAAQIKRGDAIEILSRPAGSRIQFPPHLGPPPLEILYADDDLIAVDKPFALLSVATAREKNLTAIHVMREWLSGLGAQSRDNLHAAHRLDREASGVLLLARSLSVKKKLAADWRTFEKVYLALCDGIPAESEGTITVPLWEDKGLFVRPAVHGDGEEAVTHYRVLQSVGGRTLFEVRLGTGRKHQIRVHLAHIGCPIVGDLRYGRSKAKRLALHASRLKIFHPVTGLEVVIQAKTPKFFKNRLTVDLPTK